MNDMKQELASVKQELKQMTGEARKAAFGRCKYAMYLIVITKSLDLDHKFDKEEMELLLAHFRPNDLRFHIDAEVDGMVQSLKKRGSPTVKHNLKEFDYAFLDAQAKPRECYSMKPLYNRTPKRPRTREFWREKAKRRLKKQIKMQRCNINNTAN